MLILFYALTDRSVSNKQFQKCPQVLYSCVQRRDDMQKQDSTKENILACHCFVSHVRIPAFFLYHIYFDIV